MKDVHIFERQVGGRPYRIAAQSVWDSSRRRSVARQAVLGPAGTAPVVDLGTARTVGTRAVGDIGALAWVADQLDLVGHIDRACGGIGAKKGPTLGEMVLAVATQRACTPGPKRDLAEFLEESIPRVSCLPAAKFSGQAFHRLAQQVTDAELEAAQVAISRAAVNRFDLSTNVLAFDTTNFDTCVARVTEGELAQRGHAKSKRSDLRVVGLGLLVSETGQVPLLYRTYPGNGSDQGVLTSCLAGLGKLHEALDEGAVHKKRSERTLVRDGGFWSEQLELDLDAIGYGSIISLPLSHRAAEHALARAAKRGSMKALSGKLGDVRTARIRAQVGDLDRTLIVVESKELLEGQKRGIAVALKKAKEELRLLERAVSAGRIRKSNLELRVEKTLRREHLSKFVVAEIAGDEASPTLRWHVDSARRKVLETTRLGRRVLCTDRHLWTTERIVHGFRGQWNVEEMFRRAKGGGVVPWGPSFQWADSSLRLHTFAAVIGLVLVSLARIALGTAASARAMMESLAGIRATLVRAQLAGKGRPPTILIAPALTPDQRRAVKVFELEQWMPSLASCMDVRAPSRVGSGREKDS